MSRATTGTSRLLIHEMNRPITVHSRSVSPDAYFLMSGTDIKQISVLLAAPHTPYISQIPPFVAGAPPRPIEQSYSQIFHHQITAVEIRKRKLSSSSRAAYGQCQPA